MHDNYFPTEELLKTPKMGITPEFATYLNNHEPALASVLKEAHRRFKNNKN
jgi:hypothetical protein